MLDQAEAPATRRRRFRPSRLGLFVIVVALAVAIPSVLLKAAMSCGCAPLPDLTIINYANADASVDWHGGGLFGSPILRSSGSGVARACRTTDFTLHAGAMDVSIGNATETRTLRVDVAEHPRFSDRSVVIISADGHIADPVRSMPAGGYPEEPLCT